MCDLLNIGVTGLGCLQNSGITGVCNLLNAGMSGIGYLFTLEITFFVKPNKFSHYRYVISHKFCDYMYATL